MNNFTDSIKRNSTGIVIMLIASILTSTGQLFWKISQGNDIKFLVVGFLCYGLGAILMIIAFKFGSFSVLHPMLCLSYVFAILFGKFFLKEFIGLYKSIGIILIMLGVAFIGGGDY